MTMSALPAAVLWDMDGTLVDTEPYWMATETALAEQYGGEWTHADAMQLVGNELIASGRYLKERIGMPQSPEEIVDLLLDGVVAQVRQAVPWCAGARELLLALKAHEIPCGLVTMSYRRFVDPVLDTLPPGTFDAVVTGDQVTQGKPHPEAYLTAAERLGVPIEHCVAIEDSTTGAASALASGAYTVVVPNHVEVAPLPGLHFLPSLVGVGPADLLDAPEKLPDRDPSGSDLR